MIVAYEISGYDNDSYMLGSCEKLLEISHIPKCDKCGYKTDYKFTNKSFKLKKRIYDLSYTYDGICIVSLKFKEFCIREKYKNLVFKELPNYKNFFQFYITNNELEYKANQMENLCSGCNQYENVVVPIPIFNKYLNEELKDGFYQSNLWFGSGNEKSPIIVVAPKTLLKLKREKIKICFDKIENEHIT